MDPTLIVNVDIEEEEIAPTASETLLYWIQKLPTWPSLARLALTG
jgi:hypothetical protein